jgi:hypothetical protein
MKAFTQTYQQASQEMIVDAHATFGQNCFDMMYIPPQSGVVLQGQIYVT